MSCASRARAPARTSAFNPACRGGLRHRQRPAARPHAAVERELAEQRDAVEAVAGQLPGGRQHRACEREIEPGAGLAHVAGREVGGYAPRGELVAAS